MTQRRGLTALLRAGEVNRAKAAKRVLATRGGQLHGAGCALSAGLMLQATVSLLVWLQTVVYNSARPASGRARASVLKPDR